MHNNKILIIKKILINNIKINNNKYSKFLS